MQQNYFNVGKMSSSFGTEGQVVLQHVLGKKTSLKGLEVVLIEIRKDDLVPYFVSATKIKNENEVYLTLEDITSKEKAQKLVSKKVWFKEEDYKKFVASSAAISLLGFTLVDKGITLGVINEVIEQSHQLLVQIAYNGNDVLIPLPDSFIVNINKKEKVIEADLPDGLLEL